jgi:hypothetical protein
VVAKQFIFNWSYDYQMKEEGNRNTEAKGRENRCCLVKNTGTTSAKVWELDADREKIQLQQ